MCQAIWRGCSRRRAGDAEGLQNMTDQRGNVFLSFPQGRHAQRDSIDAIEQVIAKSAVQYQFLQIAIGGADDPDIGPKRACAADGTVFVPVEEAQQAHLHRPWHFADLIQKQGAAFGGRDQSRFRRGGAGKGAFLVPK